MLQVSRRAERLAPVTLLCLAMQGVFPAARTKLVQFHATRVVATILLTRVIALLTLCACHRNDRADILLGRHINLFRTTDQSSATPFY